MKYIPINQFISEFVHISGVKIVSPLNRPEFIRLKQEASQLATQLYAEIHKEYLKKGNYGFLLQELNEGELQKALLRVRFEASAQHLFPELELSFTFFYLQSDAKGPYLGFLPTLNIESSGEDLESLKHNLTENIKLEFIRKKRLKSVHSIISTQWFEGSSIEKITQDFAFYTLAEVNELQAKSEEQLLPKVAQRLIVSQRALFGLEEELDQLVNTLKAKHRSSVLIVAASGKGKTSLIQEFARQRNKIGLKDLVIWEISAAQLLHRLSSLGSWEEYLGDLCRELRKNGDLLYIPNFAELFEVGQYVGNSMSIGDYLRDYISRGDITLISECTPEAAAQIEMRSPGYLGLMSNIQIGELKKEQVLYIIRKKVSQLAEQKSSLVESNAVEEILRLQQWYTPYSELPGKTIHFLHSLISDRERSDIKIIDKEAIHQRFSQETGMPGFMINPDTDLDIEAMTQFFQKNIYGQGEAILTVVDLLISVKAALIRRGKPLASLLFVGPTGVGKTEMAKVLAQFMFGNRDKMLRFDMSEYSDLQAVMRLTGDAPGGEGLLTAAVRQAPFSVLLFDELEKVHPAFYDLLLQILGEGRLTDAKGRVADFCSTIIIMTSNIGARSFQSGTIGFVESKSDESEVSAHFKSEVKKHFRPELFNRLDRVITFAPLTKAIVRKIVDREVDLIRNREGIRSRNIHLNIDKKVLDLLGEVGYDPLYGARFLQRAVQEQLLIPLSQNLNKHTFTTPLNIEIQLKKSQIYFEIKILKEENPLYRMVGGSNTRLIAFVNHMTYDRRQAGAIENGNYYAKFLSQLDRMERRRKKLKRAKNEAQFWKNEQESKEYFIRQELQKKMQKAFTEIQDLEQSTFLLLNGYPSPEKELLKQHTAWLENFWDLKRDLLRFENPDFKHTVLGIYGQLSSVYSLHRLYLQLGQKLDLANESFKVWWDVDTKLYKKTPFYEEVKVPDHYTLCGVEIVFNSPNLPFVYFRGEAGLHLWTNQNKAQHHLEVHVSLLPFEKYQTPENVHRSRKNSEKPRRTYHSDQLVDRNYHYTQELKGGPLIQHLEDMFLKQFRRNLDAYLVN